MRNALMEILQSASNSAADAVAGPVDLIGMSLRALGVPVPEDAVGSSAWMARQGLTKKVPQGATQVVGETLGLLSPVVAAAKAPQIARGLLKVGENAAAPRVINRGGAAGQRGIFMGDLSKTWDSAAAAKAEAMEKAGKDARTIWNETGTFRGVDGKWRQEIDDSLAAGIDWKKTYSPRSVTVSDVLEHRSLFDAYPALKQTPFEYDEATKLGNGQIAFGRISVGGHRPPAMQDVAKTINYHKAAIRDWESLKSNPVEVAEWAKSEGVSPQKFLTMVDDWIKQDANNLAFHEKLLNAGVRQRYGNTLNNAQRSVTLHELQHAIQDIQGFSPGGSPNAMRLSSVTDDPYDLYRRLPGEAEARAVQARATLTPKQRRELFPLDSFDVPINSLLDW